MGREDTDPVRLFSAASRSPTQYNIEMAKKKVVMKPTTRLFTMARGTAFAGSKQSSPR